MSQFRNILHVKIIAFEAIVEKGEQIFLKRKEKGNQMGFSLIKQKLVLAKF